MAAKWCEREMALPVGCLVGAYLLVCRFKTLNGLLPQEYICIISTSEPDIIMVNAIHQVPRPNTLVVIEKSSARHDYKSRGKKDGVSR
jgi:hypothetical protein